MSLREVQLPSGGKAWIADRPTRAQFKALMRLALETKGVDEDGSATLALLDRQDEVVRLLIIRWEDVRDPNTTDPLTFPGDLERVDNEDIDALFAECMKVWSGVPTPKPPSESPTSSPPPAESSRPETSA